MNTFLAMTLPFHALYSSLMDMPPQANSEAIHIIEKTDKRIQIEYDSNPFIQTLYHQLQAIKDPKQLENCDQLSMEDLLPGDFLLFGFSKNEIHAVGLYLGEDQFVYLLSEGKKFDLHLSELSDSEGEISGTFPYRAAFRPHQQDLNLAENLSVAIIDFDNVDLNENLSPNETKIVAPLISSFLDEQFECYFVNRQKMPLVISPKGESPVSLAFFQAWAEAHQQEFTSLLATEGALLLRGFPVESAEDFASVIQSVLGRKLMDYRGGEGSRKKVAEGVYTSTEAPPQFHIPLHNELSCSNHAPDYICFYCDIAPEIDSGQTILGKTESITQEILLHPEIWNFFNGHKIKYISRHPPTGSFFSKVNKTHKTWQESFETNDKQEVERICREKGLEYTWLGDWIEVVRKVPAIQGPDEYFDHPYWFNQVHLYHGNPRIRGGWINHVLANLLYLDPRTRQYDVELEDGTPIPREIIYGIYDILEQNTIKFNWEKGDALIVDNRKALHGRAPYSGQRRILVSMVP